MTLPDQKAIRAAINKFLVRDPRAWKKREGVPTADVMAALRTQFRRQPVHRWRHRVSNVKQLMVASGVLAAHQGASWVLQGCPFPCDHCVTVPLSMCRFTGEHYERHRCNKKACRAAP
jgi:hypothetical protein